MADTLRNASLYAWDENVLNIVQLDMKSHYLLFIMNVKSAQKTEKRAQKREKNWIRDEANQVLVPPVPRQQRIEMPG